MYLRLISETMSNSIQLTCMLVTVELLRPLMHCAFFKHMFRL